MNDTTIKFTEFSKDCDSYESIHANLRTPFTQYSTLIIDSLTTKACFEILNDHDNLIFKRGSDTIIITFTESYSELNAETFALLLNELLKTDGIECSTDSTNRIRFTSDAEFSITAATYNVRLLLGIYDKKLPIYSKNKVIQCPAVGQFLSTSILYLIGSIGGKCFVKDRDGNGYKNQRVLMRINNSFSANFPVIANNAEFRVYCLSNDLSSIDFELVDARFRKVKLLCPMYICGTVIGDTAAETIWTGMIPPQLLKSDEQAVADFEQK